MGPRPLQRLLARLEELALNGMGHQMERLTRQRPMDDDTRLAMRQALPSSQGLSISPPFVGAP